MGQWIPLESMMPFESISIMMFSLRTFGRWFISTP